MQTPSALDNEVNMLDIEVFRNRNKGRSMGIGISSRLRVGVWLDDIGLGLHEGLKHAEGWGIDEAGIDAFGPEVDPRVLSETGRRNLAHLIRSTGLTLATLRADVGGRRLADASALDVNLSRLESAFQLGRGVGAQRIVMCLGFIPPRDDEDEQKARRTLAEALQALMGLATRHGVRPLMLAGGEPPGDLAAFLDEHDPSGLCAVDLHPGGYVSRGTDPLNALSSLSTRIAQASADDFYRGGGEAPFGRGDVSWGEVIVGLSAIPGTEPICIPVTTARECNRVEALGAAVRRLKTLRTNPLAQ